MDSSGSMTATDVSPDRMTAAREAAASFVEGLPDGFKVGVVSFSDKADVVVPPTADRDEALRRARAAPGRERHGARRRDRALASTSGVTSLDEREARGRTSGESPLVILLLSDGASTTGDYKPLEAAAAGEGRRRAGLHRRARHRRAARSRAPTATAASAPIRVPPDPETLRAGRRADRRHSSSRPPTPSALEERLRRDRLAGRRRARAARADGRLHRRGRRLLLLGGALSMLWFGRMP